jgi:hypothetical protein
MKTRLKKGIIVATTSGLLLSGLALVGAQQNTPNTTTPNVMQAQNRMPGGRGDHMRGGPGDFMPGLPGLGGRMLSEGSTLNVSFYDADPSQGGTELNNYTLNVGTDSEMSFAQNVRDAMQTAAFAVVKVSAQSRTLELANTDTNEGFGFRGVPLRGLSEGSTLEALFYETNPADGAIATTTLNFTAGVDSELAFEKAFQDAASSASFVTLNTSAQERTLDLSQIRDRFEGTFEGRGDGFGPGGFGHDGFGPSKHRGPGGFGPGNTTPDTDDSDGPNS